MSEQVVTATRIEGAERPARAFASGRVCREADCDTRLSIYNSGAYCSTHEPMAVTRTRGKKIA